MVSKEKVWKKLEKVQDPEFGTPVTKMGLIDEAEVDDAKVSVKFHLAAPMCPPPFVMNMGKQIKEYISEIDGVEEVEVIVQEHFQADDLNRRLKEVE